MRIITRFSIVIFYILFHHSAIAGASFYMTQQNTAFIGSVKTPNTVVTGENYNVTIPFPSGSITMFGRALTSTTCDNPSGNLRRNWALAIPEELNFKAIDNGPTLRFKSITGWDKIGSMNINSAKYIILWSRNTGVSVTCEDYIKYNLEQYGLHGFTGSVLFTYEIVDPGKPGAGSIEIPSGNIPGFLFANMRRELTVSEGELQSHVLNSPHIFSSNSVPTRFSWLTQQTCAIDSLNKTLDFGTISASNFVGNKKSVPLTIFCKGGAQRKASLEILNASGTAIGEGIKLGHGVLADVTSDVSPIVSIPLNGAETVNITATLKGKLEGSGALDGVAIIRINFL